MVSSHYDQTIFISCEDNLPPIHNIHNFACSISGAIILLLQIRPYFAIKSRLRKQTLDCDATLYISALAFLFYLNLHQHATGYANPDLESGGCLHSLFLSLWLNNSLRSPHIPRLAARCIVGSAASILLGVCFVRPSYQTAVAAILNGPFALYTVVTMGMRSYRAKRRYVDNDGRRAFLYWIGACFSLLMVQGLVVVEERLMCNSSNSNNATVARLFHAVVIHAVIVILFGCVFECAVRVVAAEEDMNKRGGDNNKMKET